MQFMTRKDRFHRINSYETIKLFALRGPPYAGAHMTLRAGPGRRSYITLPGALGG